MAKKMSKKNETFYANGSFDGFPVKSGLELVRVFRCREAGVVKDYKVYYDFATSRPFQVLKAKPTVNGKPVNSQKDVDKILDGYNGKVQVKYVDEYGRIYTQGFKMPN